MNLTNVRIERFRSAAEVTLPSLSNLNVLIGKNNSGKSTILYAIDAFFQSVSGGGLVSLTPLFGRDVDFFQQQTEKPITIALTFTLTGAERTELLQGIVSEAPQLRNLLEVVADPLAIEVAIAFTSQPDGYAYVKSLQFASTVPGGEMRTLLSLSADAASELADRQRRIERSLQSAEDVTRVAKTIDADEFSRMKNGDADSRLFLRYRLDRLAGRRRAETSQETVKELEQLSRSTETYQEFLAKANSLAEQHGADGRSITAEPVKGSIQTFSGDQSSVPHYVLNFLRSISLIQVLFLTERREPVGRSEAKQLLNYKVTRGGPETLNVIQTKIKSLLGVKVDAFESTTATANERTAEMDVDNFLLEVNGSGIKEALRLILDVELKKPSILLVEEPEIHLHPALEINMMQYLRKASESCQVFLTTHSTNFLDSPTLSNIYFVSKPSNKTEARLINVSEAEDQIPKELGVRLSSVFMFDRLVFVEGVSDETILRELASRLDINLSQGNVGFIRMGGSRNFAYFANQATFDFLTKRQVKCTFIIDRDERDSKEISKLMTMLGDQASINVLSRRELENYLYAPRPLCNFILAKQKDLPRGAAPVIPDVANVTAALQKSVQALKTLTIGKRAVRALREPLHSTIELAPEDTIGTITAKITDDLSTCRKALDAEETAIGTSLEAARKQVEAGWAQGAFGMVQGDLLLDITCQEFGVRYKKVTDGVLLAKLHQVEEIDVELKTILKSLVP